MKSYITKALVYTRQTPVNAIREVRTWSYIYNAHGGSNTIVIKKRYVLEQEGWWYQEHHVPWARFFIHGDCTGIFFSFRKCVSSVLCRPLNSGFLWFMKLEVLSHMYHSMPWNVNFVDCFCWIQFTIPFSGFYDEQRQRWTHNGNEWIRWQLLASYGICFCNWGRWTHFGSDFVPHWPKKVLRQTKPWNAWRTDWNSDADNITADTAS